MAETEESLAFQSPGLATDDPRQLLYGLLEATGLSIILSGPVAIDVLLREAATLAPVLRRSNHAGRGFARLEQDLETVWAAVDGPLGSAVIVFGSPTSDVSLLMETVLRPFEGAPSPLSRQLVSRGSGNPELVALVQAADVAPVWEVQEFAQVGDGNNFPTIPASVRRAARAWQRTGLDLYKHEFRDIDGDSVDVFLGLTEGLPILATTLGGVSSGDMDRLQSLAARGPYALERWDETVVFVRKLLPGVDEKQLREHAQVLVDDLATGLAELRQANAPGLPPEPDGRSIWDRLESGPSESVVLRGFQWPATATEFTTTERVRESIAEDESTFDSVDRLARKLKAERGSGFEYAWRASGEDLISPTWLTVKSASVDRESGRVVATGHLTHEVWDMPPAHDLGAIDGRNAFSFTEQGHPGGLYWPSGNLYVGSLTTGALAPLDAGTNVNSVDLNGVTGTVAALEFLGGSTGAVSIYGSDGQRQLLTVVENISGAEPIRFNADGTWLLISDSRGSTLVETATGKLLRLDVGNADWWPDGQSCLLTVEHNTGSATPRLFSLTLNAYVRSFAPISLDVPVLPEYPYTWSPQVSPDGREILVCTPAGVTTEYQQKHGVGNRAARVRLEDGNGTLVHDVFLDPDRSLERDVREARWLGRPPVHALALHPEFRARLSDPITQHEYLSPGRWADDAERILIPTLNKAIELTQDGHDASGLLPEILAALVALSHNEEVWGRQSAWLKGLRNTTSNLVATGTITGDAATAWLRYGSAIAAIENGRAELIDPVSAAWR